MDPNISHCNKQKPLKLPSLDSGSFLVVVPGMDTWVWVEYQSKSGAGAADKKLGVGGRHGATFETVHSRTANCLQRHIVMDV